MNSVPLEHTCIKTGGDRYRAVYHGERHYAMRI